MILESLLPRIIVADCWHWTGAKRNGYGFVTPNRQRVQVHRLVYELLVGPCPTGLVPDHLCRNRGCVNPDHIEWVTNEENIMRGIGVGAINASKTHCPYGYPYDKVRNRSDGRKPNRYCSKCNSGTHKETHGIA